MKASEKFSVPERQNEPFGLASSFARRRSSPDPMDWGTTSTIGAISGLRAANLAPAFPVFWTSGFWGFVTRYRGATVPDSHGVSANSDSVLKRCRPDKLGGGVKEREQQGKDLTAPQGNRDRDCEGKKGPGVRALFGERDE